jgi:hypothetical protein
MRKISSHFLAVRSMSSHLIIKMENTSRDNWVQVSICHPDGSGKANVLPRNHPLIIALLGAAEASMRVRVPPDWVSPVEEDYPGQRVVLGHGAEPRTPDGEVIDPYLIHRAIERLERYGDA